MHKTTSDQKSNFHCQVPVSPRCALREINFLLLLQNKVLDRGTSTVCQELSTAPYYRGDGEQIHRSRGEAFFTAVHIKDTRFECFAGLGSKSVVGTWTEVDYSFSLFLQGYLKYLVERPIGWEPNL